MDSLRSVKARGAVLHWMLPLLVCSVLTPSAVYAQSTVSAEPSTRVWIGPDGDPLPFQNDDEVLEFLRTAQVRDRKPAPEGINKPQVLMLEGNGVKARAILREVANEEKRIRIGERFYFRFLDSHAHECAAYDLARKLGLDLVPPAVPRGIGRPGSVQIWIEGGRTASDEGFQPRSPMAWMKQVWDKDLFDNLILNVDRNLGNMLVGLNDELWLIDHTRAFQPSGELLGAEGVQKVNRRVWERLQAMSDDELKDVVREHLESDQLDALVERRELLAKHVEGLLARLGEDAVFY
jgi:hypothetical protein